MTPAKKSDYRMQTRWHSEAIEKIEADFKRSSDTHLLNLNIPSIPNVHLYLKDESTHPTGSLKHRLARSLFLYGLCNGHIQKDTTIIEASSGSTAVSEAYFAKLLGLPFIAVMPAGTSQQKIGAIQFYNGKCHFVQAAEIYAEATKLTQQLNGHYMDQFTFAERATDWRGNNNIAESIFSQMRLETHPEPYWIVVGAGTGGTSATIGRFIRYRHYRTKLCVADPEHSVFFDSYQTGDKTLRCETTSNIEGIGRPRVEDSFIATVIDKMIKVPDVASYATIHFLEKLLNFRCGGSTGTNLYATFQLMSALHEQNQPASLVTMICDSGARYANTYYNSAWLKQHNFNLNPYLKQLEQFYKTGFLPPIIHS